MKSYFSFIPSETKPIKRISPMRTYTPANYSIFTCSPPCQYSPHKQYNKIRSSSTNTSMFLMSPEPQKKLTFSAKSILSPKQKNNGSISKLLFHHKTLLLDVYKEEEEDKSDILKASSNRYFKRKLVDFEYKQRRLSCCCTECGSQSKKIKKLLHVMPSNGQQAAKLSPQFQTQSFAMIKSMKSIKSSTTKFSNADLSNQQTAKIMVNSLTPQKQFLLKKREVNDKQLPVINKSSILIEFQRKKNNLNNLVETSILKSPKTIGRNSAPNLERFESPNSSPNINMKINCLNLLESYRTDRFTTDFFKIRTQNNLKINSFRQKGKNIMDCYLKKNSTRKLGQNSNILLKTFAK